MMDITVGEFIRLCRVHGFHFTAHWVTKKLSLLEKLIDDE